MNRNIKSVMTKEELDIVQSGTVANVKLHSLLGLESYIQLTRALRDKYRDLVELHKDSNRHRPNHKNKEKAHIFEVVLRRYERQYEKNSIRAQWRQ